MAEILTPEQMADCYYKPREDCRIRDSHEALRARVEELELWSARFANAMSNTVQSASDKTFVNIWSAAAAQEAWCRLKDLLGEEHVAKHENAWDELVANRVRVEELETERKFWDCDVHGQSPNAWGCPECTRELRSQVAALRGQMPEGYDFSDDATVELAVKCASLEAQVAALREAFEPVRSVLESGHRPSRSPETWKQWNNFLRVLADASPVVDALAHDREVRAKERERCEGAVEVCRPQITPDILAALSAIRALGDEEDLASD